MNNLTIVGGTAGVGKTATCRELQKILPRNVFLDGDWCWDMHPFVVTEETKAMVNSNIAHLLNGFLACSEFENVIFCWVLHEQHILDDLINALNLNGCTTHRFSLVSTEQALVERLNRDIAAGKRGADIAERSVARISLYDELDTVKIDVSTISPADAARRITEHMARSESAMNTQESADSRIVDPARLPFAYQDALNAGDADTVVALFHQDATMHTFTGKVLTDQQALHAEAVQSIAAQARLTNKPRSTLIGGDTALIIVDWDLEAMLPDGTGISPTGTTTAVARRSADGSWRFAILDCQAAVGSPGGGHE
jgi:uncharacterized protein (TIGR02246 family)